MTQDNPYAKGLLNVLIDFENTYPADQKKASVSTQDVPASHRSREEAIQYMIDMADDGEVDEAEKVSGSKLKSHLYKCCDILRGPVLRGLYRRGVG